MPNYSNSVTTQNSDVWQVYQPTITSPHQHTIPSPSFNWPPPQPAIPELPLIEGLDELCEMLGVEESDSDGGILLKGVSNKEYSLVSILRAQMELMVRLNILLVHREIVPEAE